MRPKNRIKVRENGPLLCTGEIKVVDPEGEELYSGDEVVLCRCGASANKPFCDGSHRDSGFAAEDVELGIDSAAPENDQCHVDRKGSNGNIQRG
jgi:CDGSH-type Zn-finger protein